MKTFKDMLETKNVVLSGVSPLTKIGIGEADELFIKQGNNTIEFVVQKQIDDLIKLLKKMKTDLPKG